MAIASKSSSLPQAFLFVSKQWRQQKLDRPARSSLDFGRYRHAGTNVDLSSFHVHSRAIERDARRVDQFLPLRFTGVGETCGHLRRSRPIPRLVTQNRILREADDLAVQQSISSELKVSILISASVVSSSFCSALAKSQASAADFCSEFERVAPIAFTWAAQVPGKLHKPAALPTRGSPVDGSKFAPFDSSAIISLFAHRVRTREALLARTSI